MKSRRGFTIIEFLVVVAIISILAAIMYPIFARARQRAMGHAPRTPVQIVVPDRK